VANATFYGETGDGYLYAKTDAHWSVAREAAIADVKDTAGDTIRVGVAYIDPPLPGNKYRYYRGFLYFDTSSLPDNATVTAATLKIYLVGNLKIQETGIKVILFHAGSRPTDPLSLSDFDLNFYASGGADDITVYTGQSGYQVFTFNATGCGWINLTGKTTFCLRTEQDVSPTLPNLYMLADFYSADKGVGYRPVLEVTYGVKPTVSTDAASGVGSSYATGNGNITDIGDGSLTEYGFIWNDDGSDPVNLASADNKVVSTNLSGGVFSANLIGLTPEKTYYYRAYATTEYGTAYGDAVDFTTTAAPLGFTVTTEEPTDVLDTSATCHGTIVEDNGYTITQHGVVYALEADPGTPDDPTTAEGYTQEGAGSEGAFTSDLTGLTENSVYFYRAYAQTTDDGGHVAYGTLQILKTGVEKVATVYGDPGDGSLYNYDIWDYDDGCQSGHCRDRLVDDSTAAIGSSSCGESGGPWSYPERALLLTNESEIELYTHCGAAGGYCCDGGVVRAYLYFDTSSLEGKPVKSAKLKLYVTYSSYRTWNGSSYDYHSQGYKVGYNAYGLYPSESNGEPDLDAGDFGKAHYSGWVYVSSPGGPGDVNAYVSVDVPAESIDSNGLSKFCVMLYSVDEFGTSYGQSLKFLTADSATNKPYLEITYVDEQEPPAYPKVQIGGAWKSVEVIQAIVGGVWRYVKEIKSVIGGVWKDSA